LQTNKQFANRLQINCKLTTLAKIVNEIWCL